MASSSFLFLRFFVLLAVCLIEPHFAADASSHEEAIGKRIGCVKLSSCRTYIRVDTYVVLSFSFVLCNLHGSSHQRLMCQTGDV